MCVFLGGGDGGGCVLVGMFLMLCSHVSNILSIICAYILLVSPDYL